MHTSTELGITNTFQQVGEFANTESANKINCT